MWELAETFGWPLGPWWCNPAKLRAKMHNYPFCLFGPGFRLRRRRPAFPVFPPSFYHISFVASIDFLTRNEVAVDGSRRLNNLLW